MFLTISTCIILILIFFQDLKYRKVHAFLFLLLLIFCVLLAKNRFGMEVWLNYLLFNSLFLLINIILLQAYFYFYKGVKNFYSSQEHIGFGDILFWVVILPLFAPDEYVIYFIGSLLFSLISYISLKHLFRINWETIPLAGLQSIPLFLHLLLLLSGYNILSIFSHD